MEMTLIGKMRMRTHDEAVCHPQKAMEQKLLITVNEAESVPRSRNRGLLFYFIDVKSN